MLPTGNSLKQENKRLFLVESETGGGSIPLKSVFSLGNYRHNVTFKDHAQAIMDQNKDKLTLE